MAKQKPRKRYKLLFYRHSMNRLWRMMLLFSIVLAVLWWFGPTLGLYDLATVTGQLIDILTMAGIGLSLLILFMALIMRMMAYTHVNANHVRIVTPFIRMNIPISQIVDSKAVEVKKIIEGGKISKSAKRFFRPYYRDTAVSIKLKTYPVPPLLMNIFLPRYFRLQNQTGFLMVVDDWMNYSLEIDGALSAQQGSHRSKEKNQGFSGLGLYD